MSQNDDLLRRPLYVFDLPDSLLSTLQFKDDRAGHQTPESNSESKIEPKNLGSRAVADGSSTPNTSCTLCGVTLGNVKDQRTHVRSDLHGYNLKQRMKGLKPVTEMDFEKLLGDLDESISGSDTTETEDEDEDPKSKDTALATLLRKQATLAANSNQMEELMPKKRRRGAGRPPLLWFTTPLLPLNFSMGIYRALFTNEDLEQSDVLETIRKKQLSLKPAKSVGSDITSGVPLPSSSTTPHIFLCMIGGGHFAAMVVSLAPEMGKKASGGEERQAKVLAHKTFHRYTTRRKQGGAQSSNDAAKGAAHSAGSSLRRYNEGALIQEVRSLLSDWKGLISTAQLLYVRATGSTNRRTLYGPYDDQVLYLNDPRIRGFPFSTRRATQAELMRAFVELTRVKISQVDEAALAVAAAEADRSGSASASPKPGKQNASPAAPKLSQEEEAALHHTSQIEPMIRRSRAPAVTAYFSNNSLPTDFFFHPRDSQQHHHAATPLHLAASVNSPAVALALLTKIQVDPSLLNGEDKPAFDLAGDRSTRDAFRVGRHELGEDRWDWAASHVPPALSKADAEKREERDRQEAEAKEAERRKAEMQKLAKDGPKDESPQQSRRSMAKTLGVGEKSGAEKREEEARGMTPEMRAKLERERRARAAEERIRRMQGGR